MSTPNGIQSCKIFYNEAASGFFVGRSWFSSPSLDDRKKILKKTLKKEGFNLRCNVDVRIYMWVGALVMTNALKTGTCFDL